MDRRSPLKGGGVAAATAAVASPAIAQGQPEIRWGMASSYPKGLDTLFGAGAHIARALRRVVAQGAQLKACPKGVMEAAHRMTFQDAEIAAQNPKFKNIHDHWLAFREKELQWFRIGEAPFGFSICSQRN